MLQATGGSHDQVVTERQVINKILDLMSATLRIPLVLRDMDELSYEEISAVFGVGLSAVKMRIKRAREEFRERYRAHTELAGHKEPA